MTLCSSLPGHRLLLSSCASLAVVLAACRTDDSAPKQEASSSSSQAASADAGKTAAHARVDAGSASAEPSEPDASAGDDSDPSGGTDDTGDTPPPDVAQSDSGVAAYSWPVDCDQHYTFLAHNESVVGDTSKKKVAAGSQYYASYYFRAPFTTAVQGLKFRSIIDNKKIVHHWILYGVDSATSQDGSVQGGEGQPIGSMQGEFYIAGWAPGALDITLPDGVGLHMPTGADAMFRLEVHYFNTSANAVTEEDGSGVEFCTTSHARPQEAAVHWLGTTNVYVPPGKKTDIKSTCKPLITSGPVHLLSLSAHMHTTGVHAQAILNRASGMAPVTLIDDPFSFNEQRGYTEPRDGSAPDVQINAGDSVDVTCSYENMTTSAKTFGSNTENEMCFFYAMAWPRGQLRNGSTSVVPGAEPEVNCIK